LRKVRGKKRRKKKAPKFHFPGVECRPCFPWSYYALKIKTRFCCFPHSFVTLDENCFWKQVSIACLANCFGNNFLFPKKEIVFQNKIHAFGCWFLKQKGPKQFWPETRFKPVSLKPIFATVPPILGSNHYKRFFHS
jgi:hypothetical protein